MGRHSVAELVADRQSGRAECQAGKHSSKLTVAVKVMPDGIILIKCHAGCDTESVLQAEGLTLRDLYPAAGYPAFGSGSTVHQEQVDKAKRDAALMQHGDQLRTRDMVIQQINNCVKAGTLTTDEAMDMLAFQYEGYSELEYRFEILRTGTDDEVRELLQAEGEDDHVQ